MQLHYLQHVPFEGLGSIGQWAQTRQHGVSVTRLYDSDVLPGLDKFDLLIVMGGPMGINDEKVYPWLKTEKEFLTQTIAAGKPVLGVCLGAQLLADVLGAKVSPNAEKEIGWFPVQLTAEGRHVSFFQELPPELEVFHWHGDTFKLPQGASLLASSVACRNQAFVYNERVLALQFHLETTPESAASLIEHCRDELVQAPYIQTEEDMSGVQARFRRINHCMETILEEFERIAAAL